MSNERIKKYLILFIVFSAFIFLSYLLIRDFIDRRNMNSLEQNAYQLFDKIDSINNKDITIDNSVMSINIENNIKLPQKGIIKKMIIKYMLYYIVISIVLIRSIMKECSLLKK